MNDDGVMARRVQVRRVGRTVGLLVEAEVTHEDLDGLRPGEPLVVLAAFDDLEAAERVSRAFHQATQDAQEEIDAENAQVAGVPVDSGRRAAE